MSLVSTWFTGGQVPDLTLGFFKAQWVDWWTIPLGLGFVAVTLFAPEGIGGLFDLVARVRSPDRHGADFGSDAGNLREKEASECARCLRVPVSRSRSTSPPRAFSRMSSGGLDG